MLIALKNPLLICLSIGSVPYILIGSLFSIVIELFLNPTNEFVISNWEQFSINASD